MKKEFTIEPLSVWKNREGGTTKIVILCVSKNKQYVLVSGLVDEVSPLLYIDYLISKYQPDDDF